MNDPQIEQSNSQEKQTIPLKQAQAKGSISKIFPALLVLIIVAAGIFSGLVFSSRSKSVKTQASTQSDQQEVTEETKKSFSQTFKDESEGTIEKNDDLDKYSQGTHKLIRPGGESQTAYLTSTVLSLDVYVGKKVKVYGETFGSSQVGWLMDVGKVEEIK